METKKTRLNGLFAQEDFQKLFNWRSELITLMELLTKDEIIRLNELNVVFVGCYGPASKASLNEVDLKGHVLLVTVDANYYRLLSAEEFIGVLLHEIGHVFNPTLKKIEGEYEADAFAKEKGYAECIISGLKKGLQNKWLGFEAKSCQLRIERLRNPNQNTAEDTKS